MSTETLTEKEIGTRDQDGALLRGRPEFLTVLHSIMESFVDRAFRVDGVQHAVDRIAYGTITSNDPTHKNLVRTNKASKHLTQSRTADVSRKRRKIECRSRRYSPSATLVSQVENRSKRETG
jgi:hypothetical protein